MVTGTVTGRKWKIYCSNLNIVPSKKIRVLFRQFTWWFSGKIHEKCPEYSAIFTNIHEENTSFLFHIWLGSTDFLHVQFNKKKNRFRFVFNSNINQKYIGKVLVHEHSWKFMNFYERLSHGFSWTFIKIHEKISTNIHVFRECSWTKKKFMLISNSWIY